VNEEEKKARTKKILITSALMLVGATTGFLISRRLKKSLSIQVLSAVGGSLILGVPYLVITRNKGKKAKEVYIGTKNQPTLAENQPTTDELNQLKQTLKIGGLIK
jgi:hypothetical protein